MLFLIMILSLLLTQPCNFQTKSGLFDHVFEDTFAATVQGDMSEEKKLFLIKTGQTREVILEKARNSLQAMFNDGKYRFSVKARWIPGSLLNVAPDKILEVQPAGTVQRNMVFDAVYQEESHHKTAQIQLAVDTERKIPVAVERINSGIVLSAHKLEMRWISVSHNREQLADSIEQLEGKTLRRTLKAGQPIRNSDISTEFFIKAGDPVTIIFEKNGIHIGLKGEARQNGAEGEEIKIYSDETRKRYLGKVLSPGMAKWQQTL